MPEVVKREVFDTGRLPGLPESILKLEFVNRLAVNGEHKPALLSIVYSLVIKMATEFQLLGLVAYLVAIVVIVYLMIR